MAETLARKAGRAFLCLSRVVRSRRLYKDNNPVLIHAQEDLERAFQDLLSQHEEVSVRVRADGLYVDGELVFSEDGNDALPFVYYREGIRRFEFYRGLEPAELKVLVDATQQGLSFSGLGDDLVSLLWRHDVVHIRYLAVDSSVVDAQGAVLPKEALAELEAQVDGLLRAIYGGRRADVAAQTIHFDRADLPAKAIADRLGTIETFAPGFHPARGLLHTPPYGAELLGEAQGEVDQKLGVRALYWAVQAFASGDLLPGEIEALAKGLLTIYDAALVKDDLEQAARILAGFSALAEFAHVKDLAARWIEEAVGEARLRPVVTSHAATAEGLLSLGKLVRAIGPRAVPGLLSALPTVADPTRRRAITGLAQEVGIRDVGTILTLLQSELGYVVKEGLHLLEALDTNAVDQVAGALLDDPAPRSQALGARILGHRPSAVGEAVLLERAQRGELERAPLPYVQALLDSYALVVGAKGIGLLVRLLTRVNSEGHSRGTVEVAKAATRALRLIPTQGSIAALKKALTVGEAPVREAAKEVLLQLKEGRVPRPPLYVEGEGRAEVPHAEVRGPDYLSRGGGKREITTGLGVPLSSDLAVPAAATDKANLSPKTLELGKTFLTALFMAIRTGQIHDVSNRAFEHGLNQLNEACLALYAATGGFTLRFVESSVILNGVRLRLEGRTFETMGTLRQLLESHGLGGIQIRTQPTFEAMQRLVLLFAPPSADRPAGFTKDDLAEIEVLGVQRFADEEEDELKIDRGVMAVQLYAKAILAVREQRERVAKERDLLRSQGDVPTLRAVRIVQDLVELSGDRLDFLLRLASNHEGASPEELHSANACVLAIALGHALSVPRADLVDLGMAALFSELGATSLEDLGSRGAAHRSFARLLAAGGAPRSIELRAVAALESAVHPNEVSSWGKARPRRHLYGRILNVAKTYDRLTAGLMPVGSPPLLPLEALAVLLHDQDGRTDRRLADLLMNLLRAYPKGVWVELDNGERAQVESQLESARWDRPVVRRHPSGALFDLMDHTGGRFHARITTSLFDPAAPSAQIEPMDGPRPSTHDLLPVAAPLPVVPRVETPPPLPLDPSALVPLDDDPLLETADLRLALESPLESVGHLALDPPTLREARLAGPPTVEIPLAPVLLERRPDDGPLPRHRGHFQDDPQALDVLVLPPRLSPVAGLGPSELIELFELEQQVAGRLSHPGLPTRLGTARQGDGAWLAYEVSSAEPLHQHLRAGPRDPTPWIPGLVAALDHAHERGVIIGRLLPEDVGLRGTEPQLLSLAYATLIERGPHPLARAEAACAVPELLTQEGYGVEADWFLLGALLYWAASGRFPFGPPGHALAYGRILGEAPAPLPAQSAWPTIERLLEKDPARRAAALLPWR